MRRRVGVPEILGNRLSPSEPFGITLVVAVTLDTIGSCATQLSGRGRACGGRRRMALPAKLNSRNQDVARAPAFGNTLAAGPLAVAFGAIDDPVTVVAEPAVG